jgi:aminoglycoside phosphotransferase (APT) family kinase protein
VIGDPHDRVRRAVAGAVAGWFGPGAELAEFTRGRLHSWSYQFRGLVVAPARSIRIAVKVPRWDEAPTLGDALAAGPQSDTEREFSELRAIHHAVAGAGDDGLTAVVPLGHVRDVNAIVTEVIEARPLRAHLAVRPDPAHLFAAAGRWLRLYHDRVGAAAEAPFPVERCIADLERLAEQAGRWPDLLRRYHEVARAALVALEGVRVRTARLHGDFNLSNVLVTEDQRVAAIDTNLAEGPVAFDLARLITDLRTHRGRALTFGLRPPSSAVREWQAAFLSGYGDSPDPSLAAVRAAAVTERWAEIEARIASASPVSAEGVGLRIARRLMLREVLGRA